MLKGLHKGFTLIELLVVIVLLGIVSSFAVLSLNITGLDSELKEEARKIHALINLAKEEAIIHAQEIALVVEKETYVFMYWTSEIDKDKKKKYFWKEKENKIFRERLIQKGLKIQLETEQKFVFDKDDKNNKKDLTIFSSSGEQSRFELKIYLESDKQVFYAINGEISGEVAISKTAKMNFK